MRMDITIALEKELAMGDLARLAKKKGCGRYLKIEEQGKTGINWRAGNAGWLGPRQYLLRATTELSAEEIVTAYKELWLAEAAFRDLKSGLEIPPMYHPFSVQYWGLLSGLAVESTLGILLLGSWLSVDHRRGHRGGKRG